MKLHETVVEKLIQLYSLWGGRRETTLLQNELRKLELETYTRQKDGQKIVVLLEDIKKNQSPKK